MHSFPDFFQEDTPDARREQVAWLEAHLGLGDEFFARVLSTDIGSIASWRQSLVILESDQQNTLAELWSMFLHLLSCTNFDDELARNFLATESKACSAPGTSCVPWANYSMRQYLEQKGPEAIGNVTSWLTSLRFTDRLLPIASSS